MKIIAAKKILKANDQLAEEIRRKWTLGRAICVNLVGSPGCGKTTLLEGLIRTVAGRHASAVIEGDIAGQVDAERMEKIGVPVVQINTDGMCHLDATMIAAARDGLDWSAAGVVWIENIGNLVCTSGFDLGEHLRIVILSVAEGDDKLLKYPSIFQRSQALVITKSDLRPHCNFDVARVRADMQRLAPQAEIFEVSAIRGQGLGKLADWVIHQRDAMLKSMARLAGET